MEPSQTSLLMSGTPEQRVLVAGSMNDALPSTFSWEELFETYLDWPWIVMQAMHHRTVCMLWQNLKQRDLVKLAVRSGLAKNWITYAEQLQRANIERNQLWLSLVDDVFHAFNSAGIPLVCIKGGALIGDIYSPANRMLGDIDTLVASDARSDASKLLHELGYRHGIIDPVTSTLKPLSPEKQRFWSFHAHLMPKFTLETGNPNVPFLRFAVGFDFFDPHDEYSMPSEAVIERRVSKGDGSPMNVAAKADTFINLCAHIFREGVSATFAYMGDSWHLGKFSDLRGYLLTHGTPQLADEVRDRVQQFGLEKAYHYALHYTHKVYGDPRFEPWLRLCDPGEDKSFLTELCEGSRRVACDKPFEERLFDLGRALSPELGQPTWAKVMNDGECW
jgi:hypothetical protein